MKRRILIEVAITSARDARIAAEAGADRLEVSAALELDGLTPTRATLETIRAATTLPLVVMLRPRPGNFVYSSDEIEVMLRDLEGIPEPIALGCLNPDTSIDVKTLKRFPTRRVVFHRAFDCVRFYARALETLIDLGVPRVMTDGRNPGKIASLIEMARGRIEILPAGGIRPGNVIDLVRDSGCTQIHGSFSIQIDTSADPFGPHRRTSGETVAGVRHRLDQEFAPSA